MRLARALEILQRSAGDGDAFTVSLACGFEALHLRTFLAAELTERLPEVRVRVDTGLFDDLPGNIERATDASADAVVVVIEWPDLDPRLGLRRLGGWRVDQLDELVSGAGATLARLEAAIAGAAREHRVVCLAPTLPLPPLFPQAPGQSGPHELALRRLVADTAGRLAGQPGVSIASLQRLDELSPPHARRDVRDELATGFPYSLGHAAAVATALAELLSAPVPRKGLITDLDDTLWAGILDERGPEGVAWTEQHHRHGLYQQQLASLADAGVLVGVASRNDPGLVAEALARPDLVVSPDALYPVQASWGPKSDSIRRILEVWNVAPDAVVFVDDDPLARDEAAAALPGLVTLSPPQDEDGLWGFLKELRALFGKGAVSAEDALRLDSIRSAQALRAAQEADGGGGDFLARIGGTVEFRTGAADTPRALELINKTNQFNLNGQRLTEADLAAAYRRGAELVTVSYADRYGPLGVVAALLVSADDRGPHVDAWAMSCRAFARRIEHHTVSWLLERQAAPEVALAFAPTDRNAAVGDFLATLEGRAPAGPVRLSRARFEQQAPPLVHRVVVADR